jgi:esterase/lipase
LTLPLEWVKSHSNVAVPKSTEVVTSNTSRRQFNLNEKWLAINWNGVCDQLTKISIPTLIITGTKDVAVPAANSLIIAQKITVLHFLVYQHFELPYSEYHLP